MKPITDIDDPRYVKALAHPLRIRILAMLADRVASPVQLASHLDATLGTVAYHVRTLHGLGLVELVDTRQRRGATEHYYRAREHPRFPDDAWAGLAPVAKQRMLSAILQQIGQYVTSSAAAGGFDHADAHMTRMSLRLDDRGFKQLAAASRKWLREAERIEEATAAREAGEERVILFGLCGHGNFDLAAYDAYLAGTLEDLEFGDDEIQAALDKLPQGAPSIG